ncbi:MULTISPECIES: hybrid sensor histidine kinase/response regulator [unclassified Legionella]|uniref:hybrid sensor histidine kinase/response regulator n=1 Tax=unclassified Legionella TaxID=2622702 RepID=UPI001E48EFA9|nr:response regulator [Legionella sp. 31fI33]MCC5015200.1 response regulator [Legionella sp. 31fI33]
MENANQEFRERLLQTFREEAEEHIKNISSGLIELEKEQSSNKKGEIVETIYRAAHSLKGAARAVDLTDIESLCHTVENVFSALKHNQLIISSALLDALHEIVNTISHILAKENSDIGKELYPVATLITQLEDLIKKGSIPKVPTELETPLKRKKNNPSTPPTHHETPPTVKPAVANTVRIAKIKLDTLLLEVEELLAIKLATSQRTIDIREAVLVLAKLIKAQAKLKLIQKSLSNSVEKPDKHPHSPIEEPQLKRLLEFVSWEIDFVKSFNCQMTKLLKSAEQDEHLLNVKVSSLLEDMKKVVMQPIFTTLQILPKLVRDLAKEQGKNVELIIQGADTEIDRRIIEEMFDPLIHLVRNCIDHGIEKPDGRDRANKPAKGTITLSTKEHAGGHIEILVSDDGAGIDLKQIYAKAQQLGLINPRENQSPKKEDIIPLIFQSGLTTSPMITDLSGRGLGLAIVWEKTEKLGGLVTVDTHKGKGTTFRIILPLTLTTFRGVYVRVLNRQFLLPSAQIIQCLRIPKMSIKSIENRPVVVWQKETLAFITLANTLGLAQSASNDSPGEYQLILILEASGKRIAFGVDEILSEEDVLVKNLNKQAAHIRNIAGATLRNNGQVVPILNVADLLRTACILLASPKPVQEYKATAEPVKKSILVVEDSITSRTLLKGILESAGYQVSTAVDGLEAYTLLRTKAFDLVMSDVDMPKMNGFELTEKIRADKVYAQLPIVLVTALGSQEDRERGIESGANAYMAKSSFDQSNLLEIVRRLL